MMNLNNKTIESTLTINTIDAHTEGEPLRIITDGYPKISGENIIEKREYVKNNLDYLRQFLMHEPRGHADMYGALIVEPHRENSHFGIIFMHNEGYSSMCGHGIIAVVSVAIKTQTISLPPAGESINIDAPAGLIKAYAHYNKQLQLVVSFDNVPSFVECLNSTVFVEGLGEITYDLAYGGAYYAFVDADALSISCTPDNQQQLVKYGRAIKQAIMKTSTIIHPEEPALGFLYGTIFYSSKTKSKHAHSTHVCIFADGELDRSPTGTGVSARAAILAVKENIPVGNELIIESIVGSNMHVSIERSIQYHNKSAVVPRVTGRAFITGKHQFLLEKDDIFPTGFFIR